MKSVLLHVLLVSRSERLPLLLAERVAATAIMTRQLEAEMREMMMFLIS